MKKTVLTFGLISGAIISLMMLVTVPFQDEIGFDRGEIIGYTSMVLAFLLIFFGVRSYRDNVAGGTVRFGRAFAVGALIAVVASLCYVVTWEVIYFKFAPDFLTKYQAHILEKARAEGESEQALAKKKAEMDKFAELYKNPAINAAITFVEPLPVALIVALLSAGVLSRRRKGLEQDRGFARVVLPLLLMSLHASCKGSGPAPTPATAVAPTAREGYVDAGGGVRLFYRMVGTGRDTMVVLHGGPGFTMDYFAADLEPLAERHTLVFYDQRGTGRSSLVSDSTGLDAQRFAEDLEAVRGHFRLERLTMLGHSWGAAVAALYAARHPDRVGRLVIVDGIPLQRQELVQDFQALDAGRDSVTRRRMQEWREARLANPGDATACRAYYVLWFRPFYGDSAAAGRSKGDFCAGTPEARRNKIASVDRFTMASLGEWDWRSSLRAVTAPALVIHGSSDVLSVASARGWAAALPSGRLLLLEGVGHFPYLEAPDRFFAAVDEFLQGRWPPGAQPVAVP